MKKLITGLLVAASVMGAATPSFAWGYRHCHSAARFGVSANTIAKHCASKIPGKAKISIVGNHWGDTWERVFPQYTFADSDSSRTIQSGWIVGWEVLVHGKWREAFGVQTNITDHSLKAS